MINVQEPPTPASTESNFSAVDWTSSSRSLANCDDVAVVGLACRAAGGNNTPETLWEFLMEKKDASGEVPKKRWDPWLRRDPRNANIIENTTSKGYFVDDLEEFDPTFFGISPKEAELMDPHQRLALELSWEALENAGIDPKTLIGSNTAVFMGVDSDDYARLLLEDLPNIEAWSGIGTAYHGIPNRISYHFDFMGPSAAVDAACASSLIAVHLGRQSILSGESTIALVGGVNVLLAPSLTHMLDKAGALSPDGYCQSFDDDAHGYARGEGGAIIVLKKLSSALVDHDNILAVLKGTATAQDGKTNGIFAPNARAQELVAKQALAQAKIDPSTVGYVEAHATSTALGDPTEVGAISRVYGVGRPIDTPCLIGSIKPNVGHLEAASGAIGLVKAVLAVYKAQIPPQARLKKLNTRIDWENSGLKVAQERTSWPEMYRIRRAAVCSYGYGGSVSHAIIEQAPLQSTDTQFTEDGLFDGHGFVTLNLSAPHEKRLSLQAIALRDWLSAGGKTQSLHAIAKTLAQRRAHHDFRMAFVVQNHNEAINSLTSFLDNHHTRNASVGRVFRPTPQVIWVFSGHGAHWPNMGKELLKNLVFRESISSLDKVVEEETGFSALTALETGDIGGSDKVQVLTYVTQISLSCMLKSKGIEPQAVIGHSVGEIAASVVAGCLTPEEGAIIVSRRARLYARFKGAGGMALVNLPFAQVTIELDGTYDMNAAIDSSPSSCVVSGDTQALEDYITSLRKRNIKVLRVKTDIPFHSPILESLVEPLEKALVTAICPRPASIPLFSTSHPDPRTEILRDVSYWSENMTNPVQLRSSIEAALDDGYRIFLEVSTHPIVSHSIGETLGIHKFDDTCAFGIMKRDTSPEESIRKAMARLWTLGASIDFKTQQGRSRWAPNVPGMPWMHKPYWKQVETPSFHYAIVHDADKHTLLGQRIDIAGTKALLYSTILEDKTKPYPLSHPLDGTEIIPAAVYCNTFCHATGATLLDNLQLRVPVAITANLREVQVFIEGDVIRLSSRLKPPQHGYIEEHVWVDHASCKWSTSNMDKFRSKYDISDIKERIGVVLLKSFAWNFLQKIGVSAIAYPWTVVEHCGNNKEMIVKVDMNPDADSIPWDSYSWAPLLDAATSIGSSIFFDNPKMQIVSQIDRVLFISEDPPPKIGYLYIEKANDEKSLAVHVSVLDERGELLARLQSMRFSDVEGGTGCSTGIGGLVHQMVWVPPYFSEKPLKLDNVALISDDEELLHRYRKDLRPLSRTLIDLTSAHQLENPDTLPQEGCIVIYIPRRIQCIEEVPAMAHAHIWEAVTVLKALAASQVLSKFFIITDGVSKSSSPTALSHAPLHGFARIAAQEHPEIWGALIDNEGSSLPLLAIKYVQGQDVVRMRDGLPRVARLRPLSKEHHPRIESRRTLLPKPGGTYVITGGFGDLGLKVCSFLIEKGARRLVIISRRAFPPRRDWSTATGSILRIINEILRLEDIGASIYTLTLDIGSPTAAAELSAALGRLSLPPVLGIVHAAGVSEDNLIMNTTSESFARVFDPKVSGALALHTLFPPASLDFFILFSSIGQLVGTSGQSPYGAANTFLDALATHRSGLGDNAIAFQWTAWRNMGLAKHSEFLTVELQSKGITEISANEAFEAWEYVDKFNVDHAVVTGVRMLDADEATPIPLMAEIVRKRARPGSQALISSPAAIPTASSTLPLPGAPGFQDYLSAKIREAIAEVLKIEDFEDIQEMDNIASLGVDSVMSVPLRQRLQKDLGIKVPPTLMWTVETVGGLVNWFAENARERKVRKG